jgi:hypothetical protein
MGVGPDRSTSLARDDRRFASCDTDEYSGRKHSLIISARFALRSARAASHRGADMPECLLVSPERLQTLTLWGSVVCSPAPSERSDSRARVTQDGTLRTVTMLDGRELRYRQTRERARTVTMLGGVSSGAARGEASRGCTGSADVRVAPWQSAVRDGSRKPTGWAWRGRCSVPCAHLCPMPAASLVAHVPVAAPNPIPPLLSLRARASPSRSWRSWRRSPLLALPLLA